jgi:hypothetical protein
MLLGSSVGGVWGATSGLVFVLLNRTPNHTNRTGLLPIDSRKGLAIMLLGIVVIALLPKLADR